jgi:TRAP-type mannitol/chloroaromatic compound transport system substrate-binding protein
MKERKFSILVGVICLALIIAVMPFVGACAEEAPAPTSTAPTPTGEVYSWRMQAHWPAGVQYYTDVFLHFADDVEKASGGRIEIEPFAPDTIVPTADMFEAVGNGVFEIAWGYPSYWMGKCPAAAFINGQMYTWETVEEDYYYFYKMGAIEPARAAYSQFNVYLISPVTCGNGHVLWSKKPVRTIDDLEGLKIRTAGILGDVLERAGAAPVFFPAAELMPALEQGVVEATHWGGTAAGWEMHFQDVCDYIIMPRLCAVTNCEIIMNMDVWNSLPADLQKILQDLSIATMLKSESWFEYWDAFDEKRFIDEFGGEVIWMDDASVDELRGYSLEVIREWGAKDEYAGEMAEILEEFLEMTGRMPK